MDSITVSNQVKRSKIHGFCVKEDVRDSKKTQGVKACNCHFTAGAMKGTCRFETSECRLPKNCEQLVCFLADICKTGREADPVLRWFSEKTENQCDHRH